MICPSVTKYLEEIKKKETGEVRTSVRTKCPTKYYYKETAIFMETSILLYIATILFTLLTILPFRCQIRKVIAFPKWHRFRRIVKAALKHVYIFLCV